jgi:hypothetical protein
VNIVESLRGMTDLPVEVIGIQFRAHSYFDYRSASMYSGRKSPWVDETPTDQPYLTWKLPVAGHTDVEWRDAVILGPTGDFVAVQSLTDESLTIAANATRMRNALAGAGSLPDTDLDGLPDAWELSQLGTVAYGRGGNSDPLGSGRPLLLSYAQGLPPRFIPGQDPIVTQVMVDGRSYFQMEFRRRLGLEGYGSAAIPARLLYEPEVWSATTRAWSSATWVPVSDTDPWDGTGTRRVIMRNSVPTTGAGAPVHQFVRLKISLAP